MHMRGSKITAVLFGLTAVTLASLDVGPVMATSVGKSFTTEATWLRSQTAFGGSKGWSNYSDNDQKAVRTCSKAAWCRQHFGGRIRPENLTEVYAKLKESGTPLSN
jgi:hypothetical protein